MIYLKIAILVLISHFIIFNLFPTLFQLSLLVKHRLVNLVTSQSPYIRLSSTKYNYQTSYIKKISKQPNTCENTKNSVSAVGGRYIDCCFIKLSTRQHEFCQGNYYPL